MNNFENIILEQIESQVYCLTINRPKVLNALNQQTITELQAD